MNDQDKFFVPQEIEMQKSGLGTTEIFKKTERKGMGKLAPSSPELVNIVKDNWVQKGPE